jgi:hypothetical protein
MRIRVSRFGESQNRASQINQGDSSRSWLDDDAEDEAEDNPGAAIPVSTKGTITVALQAYPLKR